MYLGTLLARISLLDLISLILATLRYTCRNAFLRASSTELVTKYIGIRSLLIDFIFYYKTLKIAQCLVERF